MGVTMCMYVSHGMQSVVKVDDSWEWGRLLLLLNACLLTD